MNIKDILRTTLCALPLALAAASGVQAVPLSDLLGGNGNNPSITAGDKLFDQFSIIHSLADPGNPVDPANVQVDPRSDGGLDPGPGLEFTISPAASVTGDGVYAYSDFSFGFRVSSTDQNLLIKDASLDLGFAGLGSNPLNCTPSTSEVPCNDLGVFISEKVFADAAGTILLGSMSTEFSYLNGVQVGLGSSDSIDFSPRGEVWVEKNILLWAANEGDTAFLSGFTQRFSQTPTVVPEPSSLFLLGIGLAALTRRRVH